MTYQSIILNQEEIKDIDPIIDNLSENGTLWIISNDENRGSLDIFELIENGEAISVHEVNLIL